MEKSNLYYTLIALLCLLMVGIGILFVIEIKDFYEDWKCSTTTDFEYFKKNNCIRFYK